MEGDMEIDVGCRLKNKIEAVGIAIAIAIAIAAGVGEVAVAGACGQIWKASLAARTCLKLFKKQPGSLWQEARFGK